MAVVFSCSVCGREHPSRLLALRRRYFNEVIPQLGAIEEVCPVTGNWIHLAFEDLRWMEAAKSGAGWV